MIVALQFLATSYEVDETVFIICCVWAYQYTSSQIAWLVMIAVYLREGMFRTDPWYHWLRPVSFITICVFGPVLFL